MMLRTLVVDDEPIQRRLLTSLVAGVSWLQLVGECATGSEALQAIDGHAPDLVFLDIRLPDVSGLDVVARARHQPRIVFTTAYDQYAITALQLGALEAIARVEEIPLRHVKAHGALYNMAARDAALGAALAQAVAQFDRSLVFFGLAGSGMLEDRLRSIDVSLELGERS